MLLLSFTMNTEALPNTLNQVKNRLCAKIGTKTPTMSANVVSISFSCCFFTHSLILLAAITLCEISILSFILVSISLIYFRTAEIDSQQLSQRKLHSLCARCTNSMHVAVIRRLMVWKKKKNNIVFLP